MSTRLAGNGQQCLKWLVSRALCGNIRSIHMGEHFERGLASEIDLQTPVPLAGRKYLASSGSPGFPKHLSGPRENFPLLVKAQNGQEASMKHWAMRSREIIDEAYRQYENDRSAVAIVFRGLPNSNERDFSEWVNNLGFKAFPYVGGISDRQEVEPNVSGGATDEKASTIEPHNDMAYSVKHPKIFAITCLNKSPWGGETAICDNRDLHAKLDKDFVQKCAEKNIRYWRCLHDKDSTKTVYQSWQSSFLTEDRSKVNEFLQANGYEYHWDDNATLFYWTILPPYTAHAMSGERVWFNQVTMHHCSYFTTSSMYHHLSLPNKEWPTHVTYGDGEELDECEVDMHRRRLWESSVGFEWQNGDILFLDQLLVRHSRLGFKGDRKVAISILDY